MKRAEHNCPRPYWELELCTKCFRLTGPVLPEQAVEPQFQVIPTTDGGRVVQVNGTGDLPLFLKYCDCEVERGEDTQLAGPALFFSEFGSGYGLCWACALTPMDQTTRFGFSVCDRCRPVLQQANDSANRLVFPVARHSIVNSSAAFGTRPRDLTCDPERVVAEARVMFRGIADMRAWQATATRLNLKETGLFRRRRPARVPVPRYFEACKRKGIACAARAAQLVHSARLQA